LKFSFSVLEIHPSESIHTSIHPISGNQQRQGLAMDVILIVWWCGGIGEVEGTVSKMWVLISTYLANSETLTKNEVDGIDIGH